MPGAQPAAESSNRATDAYPKNAGVAVRTTRPSQSPLRRSRGTTQPVEHSDREHTDYSCPRNKSDRGHSQDYPYYQILPPPALSPHSPGSSLVHAGRRRPHGHGTRVSLIRAPGLKSDVSLEASSLAWHWNRATSPGASLTWIVGLPAQSIVILTQWSPGWTGI